MKSNRNSMDSFENWEIPEELRKPLEGYSSDTEKIVIFEKTKTYMPAEKIFAMQVLGGGAGLDHVASKHCNHVDGFKDRYDNLALFICSDYLYDDQVIDVKASEEIKQIGVCAYRTVNNEYEQYRTAPIVMLVNEEMFMIDMEMPNEETVKLMIQELFDTLDESMKLTAFARKFD